MLWVLYAFMAVPLWLTGGLLCRRQADRYLGLTLLLVGNTVLYISLVNTPWRQANVALLLPLNLVFMPMYTFSAYLEQRGQLSRWFTRTVLALALLELATTLLPWGAWGYVDRFEYAQVYWAFENKRRWLLLFLPLGGWMYWKLRYAKDGWLRWAFLLVWLLALLPLLASWAGWRMLLPWLYAGYALGVSISLSLLGLYYLRGRAAVTVLVDPSAAGLQPSAEVIPVDTTIEEAGEGNIPAQGWQHYQALQTCLANDRCYRQPDLKVGDLAALLGLSPGYVSRLVNVHAGMGFNDLINRYRVEEILERLNAQEHRQKTIQAIAEECGFRAKSTFHAAFRKQTGVTPSEWLRRQHD